MKHNTPLSTHERGRRPPSLSWEETPGPYRIGYFQFIIRCDEDSNICDIKGCGEETDAFIYPFRRRMKGAFAGGRGDDCRPERAHYVGKRKCYFSNKLCCDEVHGALFRQTYVILKNGVSHLAFKSLYSIVHSCVWTSEKCRKCCMILLIKSEVELLISNM